MVFADKNGCQAFFADLVSINGVIALKKAWLLEKGFEKHYYKASNLGNNMETIAKSLKLHKEFKDVIAPKTVIKWTPEKIDETAKFLIDEHGFIPLQAWLQQNGYSGFVNAVTRHQSGLNAVRQIYYNTAFLKPTSRDGRFWDSWSEVNLVNFFWARNITILKGRLYPAEYAETTGKAYGKFDMGFHGLVGAYTGQLIDLEVWGDMFGAAAGRYAETRRCKEAFNKDNPFFIGVHHKDTMKEAVLEKVLAPFIGIIHPQRFGQEYDSFFRPSIWSRVDEVMKISHEVCSKMPDGILPPASWFKKAKPHKDRAVADWELPTWRGFTANVSLIGGFDKVRELLQQKTHYWTREKALKCFADCYEEHKTWPNQVIWQLKKGKSLTPAQKQKLNRLRTAVKAAGKLFGSTSNTIAEVSKMVSEYVAPPTRILPRGVHQERNKYIAQISVKGKAKKLGSFETPCLAHNAYLAGMQRKAEGFYSS